MEHLEWNKFLDEYLTYGNMRAEDYYKLNDEQKKIIQEIKKAFKRITKDENI